MDKRTVKQYQMFGRYEAKRLYPIGKGTLCADCGKALATDHHHVDGNTHNNKSINVVFLCRVCHLRRERKDNRVGSRSKLTAVQIARIMAGSESIRLLAREFGIHETYCRRIRNGEKKPKPADSYQEPSVPSDFAWQELRGKPRALTVTQVKRLIALPVFGSYDACKLSKQWKVSLATIYKVRGRRGCYSDKIYD